MKFVKPYKSVDAQLNRLKEKAMIIDIDADKAIDILSSITYYRFAGYALPFLDKKSDVYTNSVLFSDVLALYRFDASLREKFTEALCAIEVTLRTNLANEFASKYGPLGYLESSNFVNEDRHASALSKIVAEFDRSKQPCAAHFKALYDNPPIWAVCDVITFGAISTLVKLLKKEDQNAISSHYGMRGDVFASYMQHMTVLRNLCAHHCRLFDFPYSNLKVPPQEYIFRPLIAWKKARLPIRADRPLLYQSALIYHLLSATAKDVFDRDVWKRELCDMMNTLPSGIVRRVRGYIDFPEDAVNSPLWNA